jgi:hypothetical protein
VYEHVFAASFLLDKAKAFLAIEELHRSFAGADNLSGHAVETAAATATATRAAAAIAATVATTESIAAAVTAATAIAVTSAETVATAIIIEITGGRESVHAAAKRIKTVLAESVALVPAAPTASIVTHNLVRTLLSLPTLQETPAAGAANRAGRERTSDQIRIPSS